MYRTRSTLLSTLLLLILTACGGGGGGGSNDPIPGAGSGGDPGSSPGTGDGGGTGSPPGASAPVGIELEGGVSGTGLNAGPVQGFGSVIVNGLAMDVSNATLLIEGVAATQDDLRIGQQVSVIGDLESGEAIDLRYRADAIGPLADLVVQDPLTGNATATVLGQPVILTSSTFYQGTRFAELLDGQVLAVSGSRSATGALIATYVSDQSAATEFKVVGIARNVSASSFEIQGLEVSFDAGALQNFAGAALRANDRIEAAGAVSAFSAPAMLTADRVERLPVPNVLEQAELALDGFIDRFNSSDDFNLNGQPVRVTAATTFLLGEAEALALNSRVAIEGTTNENRVLEAGTVTLRPLEALRVEGPAGAINLSDGTVTVVGVTFALRALTELEDDSAAELAPLTLADLSPGDQLEIRGFVEGTNQIAVRLEREAPDADALLRAPVTRFDATSGSLELLGIPLTLGPDTQYENSSGTNVSQAGFFAALQNGLFVKAEWDNFAGTGTAVAQLSIEEDDG